MRANKEPEPQLHASKSRPSGLPLAVQMTCRRVGTMNPAIKRVKHLPFRYPDSLPFTRRITA
jgi:hypothetical protein